MDAVGLGDGAPGVHAPHCRAAHLAPQPVHESARIAEVMPEPGVRVSVQQTPRTAPHQVQPHRARPVRTRRLTGGGAAGEGSLPQQRRERAPHHHCQRKDDRAMTVWMISSVNF